LISCSHPHPRATVLAKNQERELHRFTLSQQLGEGRPDRALIEDKKPKRSQIVEELSALSFLSHRIAMTF
jgi:hypothetical protein